MGLLEIWKINFKGTLGGVNQTLLRQHFLAFTTGWMRVPVPETNITERSPCILGEENLGADHELRIRFVDYRRHFECPKGDVRWQLLGSLGLRVKVGVIDNSDNTWQFVGMDGMTQRRAYSQKHREITKRNKWTRNPHILYKGFWVTWALAKKHIGLI